MTKFIPLAAVALLASFGAASAENTFELNRPQSSTSTVALTDVQADQAGRIEVYGYSQNGAADRLLGSAQVLAGTTADVNVPLIQSTDAPLRIILSNSDNVVALMDLTQSLRTSVLGLGGFRSAPLSVGPELARAAVSDEATSFMHSSDGQIVHDRRGNPVSSQAR